MIINEPRYFSPNGQVKKEFVCSTCTCSITLQYLQEIEDYVEMQNKFKVYCPVCERANYIEATDEERKCLYIIRSNQKQDDTLSKLIGLMLLAAIGICFAIYGIIEAANNYGFMDWLRRIF